MAKPFSTLVELFNDAIVDHAPKELFGEKQPDGSWTWIHYRDFGEIVAQARGGLAALGIGRGDRVAMISDNRVAWAAIAFGAFTLGAVIVPMYEAQHADEWAFILRDSGSKVVLAANQHIFEALEPLLSEEGSALQHIIGLALPASDDRSYQALLEKGRHNPTPLVSVEPKDLAGIIYTSGTTGSPKGVCLSHGNFSSNVVAAGQRFEFEPTDISLAFLPWAHSFGQTCELYTFINQGAGMALNDEIPQLINNLPVVKPSVLVAVPRIFNRIYDGVNKQVAGRPAPIRALFAAGIKAATKQRRGDSLSLTEKAALVVADKLIFDKIRQKFGGRLRFVVSGSAALSPEVAEFIDALGIEVFEGYGLTETSPVVSANFPRNRKIGSIGKPFPGVTVRIDTQATGDAKNGEILVSGPNVMQGYYNRPEETAKVFTEDGAFRTGDMGYIDDEGFIIITGRIKEQYKLENGKYVVPSPLEEQLKLSPYIANVMLHGANKLYNVALVVPDMASLKEHAAANKYELGDAAHNPKVVALIQSEIDKYSESFKGYERPKKVMITLEDFTTENGMLTPKMSLKRHVVLKTYGPALDALYKE